MRFRRDRHVFHPEYFAFVLSVLVNASFEPVLSLATENEVGIEVSSDGAVGLELVQFVVR